MEASGIKHNTQESVQKYIISFETTESLNEFTKQLGEVEHETLPTLKMVIINADFSAVQALKLPAGAVMEKDAAFEVPRTDF